MKPRSHFLRIQTLSALIAVILSSIGVAQAEDWEVGLTFNAFSAGGEPTNDILGQGIFVKKKLTDRSKVAIAIDQASDFDFEEPARFIGIAQDPNVKAIDAKTDKTSLNIWYEKAFGRDIDRGFFWKAGLSVSSLDSATVTGPRADGGAFTIATDAGTEVAALAGIGFTQPITENFNFIGSVDVQYNFADWKVTDSLSGTSRVLDDYTSYGARIGLSYEF